MKIATSCVNKNVYIKFYGTMLRPPFRVLATAQLPYTTPTPLEPTQGVASVRIGAQNKFLMSTQRLNLFHDIYAVFAVVRQNTVVIKVNKIGR